MRQLLWMPLLVSILLGALAPAGDGRWYQEAPSSGFDAAAQAASDDGMRFYFGNLHSHTAYSDGEGTPEEAFAWARDEAGYDFYVVTDHAEQLGLWEWWDTGVQADAFDEKGRFVALRGFEWTHPLAGHINVLNTKSFTTSSVGSPTLKTFYRWLDRHNGLAQFDHPGREPHVFQNFAFEASVVDNIFAIETGNKATGNNDGAYLAYYPEALDNGWRVAPANNQDNHRLSTNSHRTVIIAPELSRPALLEALIQRRIYASDDPNIQVLFKHDDQWMGATIAPPGDSITFTIDVRDDEPIRAIELLHNGAPAAVKTLDVGTGQIQWHPEVPGAPGYYFVKIISENLLDDDGGQTEQIAVTAPITLTNF